MNDGILEQIKNNSINITYNKLTLESLNNILDEVNKAYKNRVPSLPKIYVGRLTYIILSCIGLKDLVSITIIKLSHRHTLYTKLLKLSDLKHHHILVGHSKMSIEDYNKHRLELINTKADIENRIYTLFNNK